MVNELRMTINDRANPTLNMPASKMNLVVYSEAVDNLITEGGEDFYKYVDRIGLAKDPNMIVLSSQHHYYYDADEISNTKTVINLKELNQIKEIKNLLQSYLHFLPASCNFIGCFVNNKKVERFELRNGSDFTMKKKNSDSVELGILSPFPFINMLFSMMDLKTNTYMSEASVTSLLKDFGFKVVDMTETNGLTFFHSRKVGGIKN
jgi:hypothetical protein